MMKVVVFIQEISKILELPVRIWKKVGSCTKNNSQSMQEAQA